MSVVSSLFVYKHITLRSYHCTVADTSGRFIMQSSKICEFFWRELQEFYLHKLVEDLLAVDVSGHCTSILIMIILHFSLVLFFLLMQLRVCRLYKNTYYEAIKLMNCH